MEAATPPIRFNGTEINRFIPFERDCAAGCEELGNCNKELGLCECPWARRGVACMGRSEDRGNLSKVIGDQRGDLDLDLDLNLDV